MKIEYETKAKPILLETKLKPSKIRDAQFFIYKEEGFVDYTLEVDDNLEVLAKIGKITETSKKYIISSNTDNIIATDIVINGITYFYKVTYLGNVLDLKTLLLNTSIPIVEEDGIYYTNEVFSNLEIKENVYIFSEPIYSGKKHATIKYKKDNIELSFKKGGKKLYFKTMYTNLLQPNYVNKNKIYFDNFYIKRNRKIHKCIEGDIRLINKVEFCKDVGNRLEPKDLVVDSNFNFYNFAYNSFYFKSFSYTRTNRNLISYTGKHSNHIFNINDKLYFNITERGLEVGNKDNYLFCIKKVINPKKFNIVLSSNLNKVKNDIRAFDYQISNKPLDMNEKVGLKENVVSNFNKPVNESYYIEKDDVRYYQYYPNSTYTKPFYTYIDDYVEFDTEDILTDEHKGIRLSSDNTVIHRNENIEFAISLATEYSVNLLAEDLKNLLIERALIEPKYTYITSEEDEELLTEDEINILKERREL